MRDGDIVVLKVGTSEVWGVGIVVGDYEWCPEFGDVDGWDLAHVRRVRWVWKAETEPRKFEAALKFGDTVQPLSARAVCDWIAEMQVAPDVLARPLSEMPSASEDVDLDTISDYLFDQGMASTSIQTLLHEIGELVRVAHWYQRSQDNPSESETIAYLVAPLLKALGWTPQTMGIEWNRVDVALFSHLPRRDDNLAAVVEAKAKGSSCLTARSQAQYYAEQPGRASCHRLVVTDGLRYGIFVREDSGFTAEPRAYLNLTRMRKAYPIYDCDGAKEAFWLMSPYWRHAAVSNREDR